MIKNSSFWTDEANAPLLNLEGGYFKQNPDKAILLATNWKKDLFPTKVDLAKVVPNPIAGAIDENYVRIFEKDAERTFATKPHREQMIKVLSGLFRNFGDYSQSLGYVASLLMLLLDTEDAVVILEHLNFQPKYIPGYWKAQAVDFGRDAFVFQALLEKFHPEVAAHLLKNGIYPNTYCQKWFSGLCIHVLPFESLMEFFDRFLREGHVYLFRFGLSLVEHLKAQLLATNDPSSQFALLRLEFKKGSGINAEELHKAILATAASDKYKDLGDLAAMRTVAYETKIKPQMEAAQRRHAEVDSDDEIVFSDESEEESSESESDEEDKAKKAKGKKDAKPAAKGKKGGSSSEDEEDALAKKVKDLDIKKD